MPDSPATDRTAPGAVPGICHTPGPWIARQRRDRQVWHIDADKGDPTLGHSLWSGLAVYGCDDMPEEGAAVAEANARLIAAAPDLFAALQGIVRHADVTHPAWQTPKAKAALDGACRALSRATEQGAGDAGRDGEG